MNSDFYVVSHINKRKTPIATLTKSPHDVYLPNCLECGRSKINNDNHDLTLVLERNKGIPPDYLAAPAAMEIVSSRVIDIFQKYNVTGYTILYPVAKLLDLNENEIFPSNRYFRISITGGVQLDLERMDVTILSKCSTCNTYDYNRNFWEWGEAIAIDGSHDGSDLFKADHSEALLCTEKLMEIVCREKLTNIEFTQFDSMFKLINSPPPIDLKAYLKVRRGVHEGDRGTVRLS